MVKSKKELDREILELNNLIDRIENIRKVAEDNHLSVAEDLSGHVKTALIDKGFMYDNIHAPTVYERDGHFRERGVLDFYGKPWIVYEEDPDIRFELFCRVKVCEEGIETHKLAIITDPSNMLIFDILNKFYPDYFEIYKGDLCTPRTGLKLKFEGSEKECIDKIESLAEKAPHEKFKELIDLYEHAKGTREKISPLKEYEGAIEKLSIF